MVSSLFVISTSSQAFFLSLTPELVDKAILVLTIKRKEDEHLILNFLRDLNWERVLIWEIPATNSKKEYLKFAFLRWKLWQLKRSYSNIKKVYFGSYVNQYHLSIVAEFEERSKLFLLYDGLQVITTAEVRKTGPNVVKHPSLMRLLKYRIPRITSLKYVSPIPLELPKNDSLLLIKSSGFPGQKTYDPTLIFFIGQPLSGKGIGIVTDDYYLEVLEVLKRKYLGQKVIYVPHPRENNDFLRKVNKIMKVNRLDEIFEQYFLKNNVIPRKIFSFYSSVLLNMIFLRAEMEIKSIKIPSEEIFSSVYRGRIAPLYNYFEKLPHDNFEVIELKALEQYESH